MKSIFTFCAIASLGLLLAGCSTYENDDGVIIKNKGWFSDAHAPHSLPDQPETPAA